MAKIGTATVYCFAYNLYNQKIVAVPIIPIIVEFEDRFSESFIKEVRESVKDYREGRFKRFKTMKEAKHYLDTL